MDIRRLFIFFIVMSYNMMYSQTDYNYVGGIKLNDTTVISYKVNFQVVGNKVKGYSVTDVGGEHETRSNIFGEYDFVKKILSFREAGIVYTKSPIVQNDFCYLHVTIKNFIWNKTNRIKSNFIGLFSDNTPCINGELFLTSKEKVESKLEKVAKKINQTNRIPDSIKQGLKLQKMMDSLPFMMEVRKIMTKYLFLQMTNQYF